MYQWLDTHAMFFHQFLEHQAQLHAYLLYHVNKLIDGMVLVADVDELMARSQQLMASSFLEKIKFGVTFPGNTQHQLPLNNIIPGMLVGWLVSGWGW